MSNVFSSIQFHDSAFHRNDWVKRKQEKHLVSRSFQWWDGNEKGRAQIQGPHGRAGGQCVHPSVSWPCHTLCYSDSASWNSWYWGSKTKQFLFHLLPFLNCSPWAAKKELCSAVSLINLLPTSLRKTRPANSFPATDCCVLSHPASCWQPCVYIGNQICRYFSWDMHKEYSPMSNLISM